MIQNTLENRIILSLLEALLGGLVFLICVGKKLGTPPRKALGSVAFAFACFSGDALARALVTMSLLRGRGVLDLVRLFLPPSVLETVFLGALVVGLLPSRRSSRVAAVLLAVLASAYLVLRLAFLHGSPVLYDPPYEGAFLHFPIALLLCFLARRASPQRQILFQSALALLAASYASEAAIELYSPGALFFWNVQHAAKILALLSFALHLQEGSDLYAEFVLRLGMSLIVVTGFFALLLSETLRQGYLEVAANDAQTHLGEFLQGYVGYLHRQGLAPNVIVERDELVRKIVAEFTRVPGLKRVKLSVGDRQLLAEIDPDAVISIRTGTGIFDDRRKRVYDYDDSTVGILRIPITSGGKPIATLQFDADLRFMSRTVGGQMLLSFSSLLAVAFAVFVGTLSYNGYRRMQRVAALQAQVQQAQKMEAIGLLAGGVAHDFNNLLIPILGYSELLLGELGEGSRLRPDVEQIKKAGERAALLTRQLLAFSRKQMLQAVVLDLNSVLRNMEAMLRHLIREDVEIVVVADPALGRVKADVTQIEQVILNLAVNARDAMPQGGRLTVETANVELGEADAQLEAGMQPGRVADGHCVSAETVHGGHLGAQGARSARLDGPVTDTRRIEPPDLRRRLPASHRRLNGRRVNLAVALGRVAVANLEECARNKNRDVDGRSRAITPGVTTRR